MHSGPVMRTQKTTTAHNVWPRQFLRNNRRLLLAQAIEAAIVRWRPTPSEMLEELMSRIRMRMSNLMLLAQS
jgi:hypothetical protein